MDLGSLFGLDAGWDAFVELLKLVVIVLLLFVLGVLSLMGKFGVIPKPWGAILGLGLIGGAVYLVYRGGF